MIKMEHMVEFERTTYYSSLAVNEVYLFSKWAAAMKLEELHAQISPIQSEILRLKGWGDKVDDANQQSQSFLLHFFPLYLL
jgi:hypothetical protein